LDDLSQIVNQRAIPGTLILDLNKKLLFINKEAMALLPVRSAKTPKGKSGFHAEIPEEIYLLCDRIRGDSGVPGETPIRNGVVLQGGEGALYSARAFLIGRGGGENEDSHIMVLLERVAEKHSLNYDKVADRFTLSKREVEVVRLICEGCTNREIGDKLYISEHTVKDHIKNIMRKMEVDTRNEIVAVML
jgi:DNA-binding CsgD family transcriptional regulator